MLSAVTDYISVGGNRHPAAADWDSQSGLLAFGADNNVALWDTTDPYHKGVYALLVGHTGTVNAVRFYTCPSSGSRLLITGSADRTIRVWQPSTATSSPRIFTLAATLEGHENSINCIAVARNSGVFASGAADGTVRIWRVVSGDGKIHGKLLETIALKPRYFPLTLALRQLPTQGASQPMVLAVGGTRTTIQIYVAQDVSSDSVNFELCATLAGHEGWIRSLAFTNAAEQDNTEGFLLASASQDKYVRLWKVSPGEVAPRPANPEDVSLGGFDQTLSNKAHVFEASGAKYSITFEALLFGHEDWIYTVAWGPDPQRRQLLSSSADNSLVIWEADPVSGVWFSTARMGEISVQKGSTTATGSAGGFWIGLWALNGEKVISLGRTGSWRAWKYDRDGDSWIQDNGISGHVRSVNDIEWEPNGGYLLSTSSDQTTRLHAKWKQGGHHHTWCEFARPQIHGYDLNCIASLGTSRFVSGADEKLLRVFNETKALAQLLENLSGFTQFSDQELSEPANMPVLGLSNKAMDEDAELDEAEATNGTGGLDAPVSLQIPALDISHPPLEDHLARHTLWPEHEKLYGHGYEISAVAVTHDRTIIATACKASSIDHAVIRLYDAATWDEIRPPLTAHSLTITCLRFSHDDRFLLSVGRDRQWAVFERDNTDKALFKLLTSNPKGHSRMILGASWAPLASGVAFATAGRNKNVKIWALDEDNKTFSCKATIALQHPVTAIDFYPVAVDNHAYLAVGEDNGQITIHKIAVEDFKTNQADALPTLECPSKTINQLLWRPPGEMQDGEAAKGGALKLAVASEDSSVRIYIVNSASP
ncbi:hypothetical protein AJ80_06427 [Polytolypa hystricis UAMH7299]|uniref:Elongator complex protein 2 n=1 Tax=Polytolypa hystricis (strain UAMH7299) TaxID=1447883 RepID=A0A2B7XWN4_POLH7|nr:hypothetical protein AJ80_06427 [Polytolypa hystricis UAMH7299]